MGTSAESQPNHYEALGLRPGASAEEIAGAFAGRMRLGATPLATMAQICTAYETLRDPRRRSAYDEAMGFPLKAERREPAMAGGNWSRNAYVMTAPARVAVAPAPPRAASLNRFIASEEPLTSEATRSRAQELLRRLEEQRRPAPQPEPEAQLEPKLDRPAAGPVDVDQILFRAVEERTGKAASPLGLGVNRTVLIAGALLAGAGIIGAWIGVRSGSGATAPQVKAVTLALPQAKPAPLPDLAPALGVEAPAPLREHAHQLVHVAPARAKAAAARMPLPDAVVARTIERIGYSCGSIASTSAVDGRPGVFTVTCASGQSYRATPMGGRYHFRRSTGR